MKVPIVLLGIGFGISLTLIFFEHLTRQSWPLLNFINKYAFRSGNALQLILRIFTLISLMVLFVLGPLLLKLSLEENVHYPTLCIGLALLGLDLSLIVICFTRLKTGTQLRKRLKKQMCRILSVSAIVLCLALGPLIFSYDLRSETQEARVYELSALAMFIPTNERFMSDVFFAILDIGKSQARVCNAYKMPFFHYEKVSKTLNPKDYLCIVIIM